MRLRSFIGVIATLVLTLFYASSTVHYLQDSVEKHKVLKDSVYNTMSDLDFALTKNNCADLTTSSILLKRKLVTNRYLTAITLYKGQKAILYTDFRFIDRPISTADNIPVDIENIQNLKSTITCYSNWKAVDYDLILTLNQKEVKSFFDKNFFDYFLVFVIFPAVIFSLTGYLFARFIFKPLQELKKYTTEEGVLIPSCFNILELEDLRYSTVEAFEKLKDERKELLKISRTDALTNIGNRYYLHEQINNLINDTDRRKQNFALLFIDIDDFKSINDSLGHNVGDSVLISIANILTEIVHKDDIIARIGGDEFIVLVNTINTDEKLERLIEHISNNISSNIMIAGGHLHTTVSIGVTKYPEDGASLAHLLQRGDIALFKSKELGKNKHVFYDSSMLDETLYLIELNKNMSIALENGEYELYYQAQVNVASNKIIGAEALIRWNKDGNQISPVEFIPLAEKTGFIIELGWWIITDALKEKASWEAKGLDLSMSINIAAKQFADVKFYDTFKFYVNKFNIDPSQIVLEITEYIFLSDATTLIETFNNLKALGVSISLDDFGTGYSSLSYIKNFPIDTIKIDKSFLDDYKSEAGAVFLETIISMSINLEIDIVAEGVEVQEQLDFLAKRHCKKYQGYLCSKPLPSKDFQKLYLDSLK